MTTDAIQFLLLGTLLGGVGLGMAVLRLNARGQGRHLAMLFFGLLLLVAFSEVTDLAGVYGRSPLLDLLLIPVVRAVAFLFAPTLYLYAATCLRWPLTIPTFWHAGPALLGWAVFLGAELASGDGETLVLAYWIAFALHAVLYELAMLRLLLGRVQTLKAFFSTLPESSVARLRRLWLVLLVPVATILAELVLNRFVPVSETAQLMGGSLRMIAVLTAVALIVTDQLQSEEPQTPSSDMPYANSKMVAEEAERLAACLRATLEGEALYRDPLLNLTALARRSRIPEHQISQVLNQHVGLTFYDFVNHYRIADAKRLLKAEKATVLDIALTVGYNSKSTFYAAFRKATGQTPSEYRQI